MADQTKQSAPAIGDGATVLMWSDRHAATIIGIKYFKTGARAGQISSVVVQEDKAIRVDGLGMSDAQTYTYERDLTGCIREFKVTKTGAFKNDGMGLMIGARRHYYDYSF